jgi:hypothetical protein
VQNLGVIVRVIRFSNNFNNFKFGAYDESADVDVDVQVAVVSTPWSSP